MDVLSLIQSLMQYPWQIAPIIVVIYIFTRKLGDILWLLAAVKLAESLREKGYDVIEIASKRIILVKRNKRLVQKLNKSSKTN